MQTDATFRSVVTLAAMATGAVAHAASTPNLILIFADDLGYGDVRAQNPESRLPTPNLDRLAAEGVRFADAHSASSVCTPSRYALLTGRYCWRTRLERGVLFPPNDAPLIEPGRLTLGGLLKKYGYHTACVGKWHLGIEWARDARGEADFERPFGAGPLDAGFDRYFGVAASLDMIPYAFLEGRRVVGPLSERQAAGRFPRYVREGPRAEGFDCGAVLDELTRRSVAYVRERAATGRPFFLYFPMTSPHKPVWPAERFVGATGLGPYGDFVAQTDWSVGRVLDALDTAGVADETIVLFSSDNGSFMFRTVGDDHVTDPTRQAYRHENHRPNGDLRGTKADIWEAGHRVPLLVRWPGVARPGRVVERTVCLTDVLATVAEIVGADLPPDAGEDSYSFAPLLRGDDRGHDRPAVVHHSAAGAFAVRDGRWKLVLCNGSGGREKPRGKPFAKPYQLFDLRADWGETTDLAAERPEIVERLTETLERFRAQPRSVPAL